MKGKNRFKSILVSLLVTAALAVPAVLAAFAPEDVDAYLLFRMDGRNGSGLYTMDDGSVQARITVSINGGQRRSGASFVLDYNPDYFTPSDAANVPLDEDPAGGSGMVQDTDKFFTYNPALYGGKNPFATKIGANINLALAGKSYSQLYLGDSQIIMNLWLDQKNIKKPKDMVTVLEGYSYDDSENPRVFTDENEEIVLGQLTFRVNPDRLPEIARYFHSFKGGGLVEDPEIEADYVGAGAPTKTFLVKVSRETYQESSFDAIDPWSIGYYMGPEGGRNAKYYKQGTSVDDFGNEVTGTVFYQNDVDLNTIVSVRPAEDEVTVNAYQAYTNGDVGDVALVLGQHSPMATITYIDGREENVVIPWGDDDPLAGGYTVKNADGTDIAAYDPTHGDYIVTQRIQDPHAPGRYIPLPVAVKLHVTPINLLDVRVEDQTRTYWLKEVVGQIEDPANLALPDQARLVTDIVPGGVSMVMDIPGWAPAKGTWPRLTEGNTNLSRLMNSLKEDSFDAATKDENDPHTTPKWPDTDDIGDIDAGQLDNFLGNYGGKRVGKYTFHMAEGYGTADAPKPTAKTGFTREEIQAVYPWLTVAEDRYDVPTVLRRIVTEENYTPASRYTVEYVSTVDEDVMGQIEPTLTLNVKRRNDETMAEGSIFRVWLPNGQELGTGLEATVWPDDGITVDNWFPETPQEGGTTYQNGYYKPEKREIGGVTSFDLVTNPGNPESDAFQKERETLRRYINLGGWFYVAVTENPDSQAWSDPMPVYVPPRPNEYTQDKEYNFLGGNSDLFVWTSGLTHYVSLPNGEYNDVNELGEPLYQVGDDRVTADGLLPSQKDSYGRPNENAVRATASYSYTTTYDGVTGAQPGALNVFRVDDKRQPAEPAPARGDVWAHDGGTAGMGATAGRTIYTYGANGANPFFDEALYDGYGVVRQHREGDNTVADPETVTIRRDSDRAVAGSQKITLTSVEPTGITRVVQDDLTSNVTQVTYNTKEEGYTARQSYTLTITNHGTEPIYGLAIDALTDGYEKEPTGGRFVMEKAPADYLAPGTSTSFILTYVYDLKANVSTDAPYHDILYITSSDHPTGGTGTDANYLLKFDAEVLISSKPTHNVDVVVLPEDLKMGTAHLIIGQQGEGGSVNYTPTAQSYASGTPVYVVVEPKDEYSFIDPTLKDPPAVVDALGHPIEVTEVTGIPEGQNPVYRFIMPDYDTTVTIRFYEGIYSKLRLSGLIDFSGDETQDLKQSADDTVADTDTYTVWRKSFTDDEKTAAEAWAAEKGGKPEFYLMTSGTPVPEEEGGNTFLSSENQYLVVIPYDAAYSQVEATLRELVTHNDYKGEGENKDITPNVTMHWYGKDVRDEWTIGNDGNKIIYNASGVGVPSIMGSTAEPSTKHTSVVFDSPEPGTSNYVRITVEAQDQERTQRFYYLEIHRRPENPIATLHYGNSPYGMIMNAPNFLRENAEATGRVQNVAKNAFKEGYTFKDLPQDYLPLVLQGDAPVAKVSGVTYWREAWVNNTQVFEPESNTGYLLDQQTVTDDEGNETVVSSYIPDPAVYDESTNLDLNDYAYFATLGEAMMEPGLVEALDSSGRPVDLAKVMASAEVILLDTTKERQVERFSGIQTATLDLGVANTVKTPLAADADTAAAYNWPASSSVETKTETAEDGTETTTQVTVYTPVHNIRPGQYVLTYTYPDFDGGSLSVTRPFVILPGVGDVNADCVPLDSTRSLGDEAPVEGTPEYAALEARKKRTDEYVLENRVADPLGYEAGKWEQDADGVWTETVYPRANIFKYRVCDVNNDRNVNNIDGNEINRLAVNEGLTPLKFYDPVHYGHPKDTVTP